MSPTTPPTALASSPSAAREDGHVGSLEPRSVASAGRGAAGASGAAAADAEAHQGEESLRSEVLDSYQGLRAQVCVQLQQSLRLAHVAVRV